MMSDKRWKNCHFPPFEQQTEAAGPQERPFTRRSDRQEDTSAQREDRKPPAAAVIRPCTWTPIQDRNQNFFFFCFILYLQDESVLSSF